jgi:hypothetical protein
LWIPPKEGIGAEREGDFTSYFFSVWRFQPKIYGFILHQAIVPFLWTDQIKGGGDQGLLCEANIK